VTLALIALALAGAAFLEVAGPLALAAPGETAIVVTAIALGLDPGPLAASAAGVFVGALLGSLALYGATRAATGRWPRVARWIDGAVPPQGRLASFTRRRSAWLLVIGRFVAVGRASLPVLAAQARIPFGTYALWTAVGVVLWSTWLLGLGAGLGRAAAALFLPQATVAVTLAIGALLVAAYLVRRLRFRTIRRWPASAGGSVAALATVER
jgi:membrane-associated protein